MKSSTQAVPLLAILMLVLLVSPPSVAALTCADVVSDIRPCLDYLKSGSGTPSTACCAGAKTLASAASSTADKQTACGCLKTASKSVNVNATTAKALPGNCGISLGFAIDPNLDCSTIS